MLFTELVFLVFCPLFFVFFFATKGTARLGVCLLGSYIFYGWWDWRFLFLILLTTVANFWFGQRIEKADSESRKKKYLALSVGTGLAVLAYFKYTNFFLASLENCLQALGSTWKFDTLHIILPLGISFYTLQTMTYTIDLYRGQVKREDSLLRFAVFVAFFPRLVAGPILRAADFLPQLREDRPFDWSPFITGASMVAWGYVMKCVVADSLSGVSDIRFACPVAHSSLSLIIGVVFFTFQIYADFAGYSLIAVGLARMLGYEFIRNFDRPYFSAGFSEFWRRWHISLSSWLRDYIYIPLGGNRRGPARTYVNLMLVMFLCGLWHGAAWTFLAWGFIHGAYLCMERLSGGFWRDLAKRLHLPPPLTRAALIPCVFLLTSFAWIFFRAQSFGAAWTVIRGIASMDSFTFAATPQQFEVVKGLVLIGTLSATEAASFFVDLPRLADRHLWLNGVFIVLCLITLSLLGTFTGATFIYAQF